jgi:hypothetical protein
LICLPRSLIVTAPPVAIDLSTKAPILRRRILLADDNRDAAESLSVLLKLSDHEVYVTHPGGDAFKAAKELRPDVGIFRHRHA